MGVLGLWQLLQPTARPTKLQGLEGKTLAIDVSIWLYQATKGVRNSSNGHLLVLYNRICKLLYFKVKPVFVFDGPRVPVLKQRVLKERQRRRDAAAKKGKDLDDKIHTNRLEAYALNALYGTQASTSTTTSSSNSKLSVEQQKPKQSTTPSSSNVGHIDDDMFKLPAPKAQARLNASDDNDENATADVAVADDDDADDDDDDDVCILDDEDDDEDESDLGVALTDAEIHMDLRSRLELYLDYTYKLKKANHVDKDVFEGLPVDIQIELLAGYKDELKSKKRRSFEQFPDKSGDFSAFQMRSLLHKSDISNKINTLKAKLNENLTEDTPFENAFTQQMASDSSTQLVLLTNKSSSRSSNVFEAILHKQRRRHGGVTGERTASTSPSSTSAPDSPSTPDTDHDAAHSNNQCSPPKRARTTAASASADETNLPTYRIEFNAFNKIELVPRGLPAESAPSFESTRHNVDSQQSSPTQFTMEQATCAGTAKALSDLTTPSQIETKGEDIVVIEDSDSESDDDSDDDFVEVEMNTTDVIELSDKSVQEDKAEEKTSTIATQQLADVLVETSIASNVVPNESAPASFEQQQKPQPQADVLATTSKDASSDKRGADRANLDAYAQRLASDTDRLMRERPDAQRMANSIERHVLDEAKHLLRLFGLPYVESPGEAEAQCAYLDLSGQTEGTITDDSDVWLFGARRVYKNFFSQQHQLIDAYSSDFIASQLGLSRDDLISMACMVGSDYSTGIQTVGVVKAMEIMNEFDGRTGIEKLTNFKQWHTKAQKDGRERFNNLRKSLAKLHLSADFPDKQIYDAYLCPEVDTSREPFQWSFPQLDHIKKFMAGKMTWSSEKVERDLAPVFKRLNETKVQSTLESYFAVDGTAQTSSSAKQSKRMKSAIRMLKNKSSSSQLAKPEEPNLSEDEVEEQQKKTPAGESNGASKTATTSRAKKGDTISTTSKSKPKSAPRRKKTT